MAPPADKTPTNASAKGTDNPVVPGHTPEHTDSKLQAQATDMRKPTGEAKPAPKQLEVDVAHVAERLGLPADLHLDIVVKEREIRDTRRALIEQMKNPATDLAILQKTQDTFKKQVNEAIAESGDLQKGVKGSRPIDHINESLATTERHQADLEKTLKLTAANQQETLRGILAKDASTLTPTETDYVQTLSLKQALRQAKESASVTNAVFGSAVANGLIGDIKTDANGMRSATPTAADVADAFMKMGVAHRMNGESREAGPFNDDFNKITKEYTKQIDSTIHGALVCLEQASENYNKNPAEAETQLRKVDTKHIKDLLQDNKNNPEIADRLRNVLHTTHMEYASFLYDNGRPAESAVKLNQAAVETPDQSKADPSFASLWDKVNAKSNGDRSTLEGWQTKFGEAMTNRNWAAADEAAKHIKEETAKQILQADKAKVMLDKNLNDLTIKVAGAKTPEEKAELQAQLDAAKKQEENMVGQRKIDNTNLAFLSYRLGFVHMSEKNMAEANKDFKAVADIDPELAKRMNTTPPGDLPKLDELVKQSTEPSWWQSHWRMVSGIGIGILATAAVVATGGAALPAVAIVLAGGALYTAAGATAGETSLKQLGTNFVVGSATTAVSVLLKGVPMWRAGATAAQLGTAEATSVTLNALAAEGITETTKAVATQGLKTVATQAATTTAAEGLKVTATEGTKAALTTAVTTDAVASGTGFASRFVAGAKAFPGATLQTGKDLVSPQMLKNLVAPGFKQLSTEVGVTTTLVGAKEGIYNMGMKGESWDQVKGHLGTDLLFTAAMVRTAGAASATSAESAATLNFINKGMTHSGLNAGTTAFGYSFTAVPELQNYYSGNQDANTTARNIFLNGSMNSAVFGLTANQLAKIGADNLIKGSLSAAVPYATQETLIAGINHGLKLDKPFDVTTGEGNRKTTANWNAQFEGRVPEMAPQDPVQIDGANAAPTDGTLVLPNAAPTDGTLVLPDAPQNK